MRGEGRVGEIRATALSRDGSAVACERDETADQRDAVDDRDGEDDPDDRWHDAILRMLPSRDDYARDSRNRFTASAVVS
jgi:hypothetical protein